MTFPEGGVVTRRSQLRQERSKKTRRTLLRTAARLWGEHGFDGVTVEEICSEAGVGRTTFYLHFQGKEDLLAHLPGATATGVVSDLEHLDVDARLSDRLEAFIEGVARRMEAVPKGLVALVIRSQRTHHLKARAEPRTPDRLTFADMLTDVFVRARFDGEVASQADPEELGEVLGALTLDAIEMWAFRTSDAPALGAVLRSRFALVLDQFLVAGDGGRRPPAAHCQTDRRHMASAPTSRPSTGDSVG